MGDQELEWELLPSQLELVEPRLPELQLRAGLHPHLTMRDFRIL